MFDSKGTHEGVQNWIGDAEVNQSPGSSGQIDRSGFWEEMKGEK